MNASPFLDTNILVYAHDVSAAEKHDVAKELVAGFWQAGGANLSIQVLQELYVTLTRKVKDVAPESARRTVEAYGHWRVQPASVAPASFRKT
jgi:predicted nucleic acid-binding protein